MARIMVLVAHPDDEVLGCGGTMPLLSQSGNDLFIAENGQDINPSTVLELRAGSTVPMRVAGNGQGSGEGDGGPATKAAVDAMGLAADRTGARRSRLGGRLPAAHDRRGQSVLTNGILTPRPC